jgi:sugar lactone lactonase YvrE
MNRGIIGKRLLNPSNRVSSFSANGTIFTLEDIYEASYSSEGLTSQWVKNKYSPLSTKYPLLANTNRFSFASQTTAAQCCTMSEDGTKLYIASNTIVYTYNLSTAFDVTTAVLSSSWTILGETTAKGMYFRPDGTRLFIIGQTGDDITWYNLSEAWNVNSATLVSQQLVGSTGLTGLTFNPDGTKLFVIDLTTDLIYSYNLSTPWTPSSLDAGTTYPISTGTLTPGFIEFNSDGTKMYVGDNATTLDKYLLEFKLTTAYDITTAVLRGRLSLMELLGGGYPTLGTRAVVNIEDFRFSNNGNNGLFLTPSDVWNVPLPSTREFGFFSQTSVISYLNAVTEGQGIYFKPDGTRYYITDSLDDAVYEYTMTTPWDISTSGLVRTERNFFTQDGNATDIWFKPDGTIMYLIGNDNDNIYQYNLDTAWDISTATYGEINFYVGHEDTSPTSFCLSEDGLYLFIVGTQRDVIFKYTLTIPWVISSAILDAYSHYTNPIGEGNRSLFFDSSGTNYLTLDGTGFVFDTDDFTMESWIYLNSNTRNNYIITMSENSGWNFFVNNTGKVVLAPGAAGGPTVTSNQSVSSNTWTHVAVSRNGTNLRVFIDGVLDTLNSSYTSDYTYSDTVRIGFAENTIFGGNIYGLRVIKGVGSYTSSFIRPISPPITTPETILKTGLYTSIIDGSSLNETITVIGTVQVNTAYPFSSSTYLGAVMKPDGTKSYLLSRGDYKIYQYPSGNTNYNFVNVSPERELYVGDKSTSSEDFFINNDGNKLFILDSGTKEIIQYGLTDTWNIANATFQYNTLVSELELTPTKFTFNSDGKKLFVYGSTNRRVVEYDLTESWNIATASIDTNKITAPTQYGTGTGVSYEILPHDILIANSGNTMYILGQTNEEIREFPLDIPFNPYTARRNTTNFDASLLDPQGIFLNSDEDGSKYFITNTTSVRQHTLKVPGRLYTAAYDNVFFTPSPAITIKDLSLSNTGDRLYLLSDTATEQIFQYDLELPWNIGKNTAKGTYNFTAYGETIPVSWYFRRDGKKFYIIGRTLDRVIEFNMATAWNVTTAYQDLLNIAAGVETVPQDIYFSNNGTKMYIVGTLAPAKVNEYTLSVPWEAGSATYTSNVQVAVRDNTPTGISFNSNGSIMYVVGSANDSVHQFTLSTAWDVTTATFLQTRSVSADETVPTSVQFSNTGNKMFVLGTTGDDITEYALSVNYDISTASVTRVRSISAQDLTMQGMYFKPDGRQMFLVGSTNDTVYSYNLSEAWNVATSTLANTRSIAAQQTVPNGIHMSDDGVNMYITGTTPIGVHHYRLNESWNVATANYAAFSVATQTTQPVGLAFSNTGNRMYVMSQAAANIGSVHQYLLSTPWSVGTATFERSSANTIPLTFENSPTDITFNNVGTEIYITGTSRDIVTTLNLTEAWNVSTIQVNPVNRYNVFALDITGTGIDFANNGTSFIFTGDTNDRIHQVNLTQAWNLRTNSTVTSANLPSSVLNPTGCLWANNGNTLVISTATQVIEYPTNATFSLANLHGPRFSLVTQDTAMNDIYFRPDGTSFYTVSSTTTGRVHQYNMNVAWQVATANFARSLTITTQELTPTGIWFRPEGNSMYVIGSANDTIFQYNLSTAWNIGTATYSSLSLGITATEGTPQALCFANNGTKMYLVGSSTDNIREYTLSTPWLLSSATLTRSNSILQFDTAVTGLYIDPTSSYMSIAGNANDNIQLFTFGEPGNIATLNLQSSRSIVGIDTSSSGIYFKPDGSILYLLGFTNDFINQINLTEAWNVNTGYYGVTTIAPIVGATTEVNIQGIRYANNGYDLYVLGSTNDSIYQYKLEEPFKANSGILFGSKSIANLEINATGFTIDENASEIFVIGTAAAGSEKISRLRFLSNNNINTLQTEYLSLTDRETDVRGIALSNDNNQLLVVGDTVTPNLHRYSLANSNVLSSATIAESIPLLPVLNPNKLLIKDTDERTVHISSTDGNVLDYVLDSPNILNGAEVKSSLNTFTQNTMVSASFIKPDGSKIYTLDTANDKVYQYSTSNNFVLENFTLEQEYDYNDYGIRITSNPVGSRLVVTANSLLNIYTNDQFTIRFNFNSTVSGLTTPIIFALESSLTNRAFIALNNTGQIVYSANSGLGTNNSTNVFTNGPIQTNNWYHFAFVKSANSYSTFLNGRLIGIANTTVRPTGALSLSIGNSAFGSVAANAYSGLIVKDFEILANQALYTSNFSAEITTTGDYISKPIVRSENTILLLAQSPGVNTDRSNNNLVSTTAGLVTPEKIITNTATSLFFSNTGSNMYIFGNDNDLLASYDLSSSWNVSSASLTYKPNNSAVLFYTDDVREYSPGGIHVNRDGTDLYVIGTNGAWKVYQFTLSTPHELSSISPQFKFFDILEQTREARGITFSTDGRQMYICGGNSNPIAAATGFVYSYNLSTPWDISTASFFESANVTSSESFPTGIRFREDGTHMYVMGTIGADITPYVLSTPWRISTATVLSDLKLNTVLSSPTQTTLTQITSPQDFDWLDNGNYLYSVGSTTLSSNTINIIQHRSLNNAYSTGIRDGVISLPLDTTYYIGNISGICVKSDGKKMWAVDAANAVIQQFNLY